MRLFATCTNNTPAILSSSQWCPKYTNIIPLCAVSPAGTVHGTTPLRSLMYIYLLRPLDTNDSPSFGKSIYSLIFPYYTLSMDTKICTKCKQSKPIDDFYINWTSGTRYWCKACRVSYATAYNKRPDQVERRKKHAKEYRDQTRNQILDHYGAKCVCCGETQRYFLAIDHVHGGGNAQRKELGGGRNNNMSILLYIIKNNYPPDYQILCHNCNFAKSHFGRCPCQDDQT